MSKDIDELTKKAANYLYTIVSRCIEPIRLELKGAI